MRRRRGAPLSRARRGSDQQLGFWFLISVAVRLLVCRGATSMQKPISPLFQFAVRLWFGTVRLGNRKFDFVKRFTKP